MPKFIKIVIVVITLSCCQLAEENNINNSKTLNTKQMIRTLDLDAIKIGFVLTKGFYTTEFTGPLDVFNHANWSEKNVEVFSISENGQNVTSAEGVQIVPDFSFSNAPYIDILIVPSGVNTVEVDIKNELLISFVKDRAHSADHIMSFCDGAFILAEAGILEGKNATTYPSEIKLLREKYPNIKIHEGVSFVHDGNIITSTGEVKSFEAALYLTKEIYDTETANEIADGLLIDWEWDSVDHYKHKNQ